MITLHLEKTSSTPLFRQIVGGLKNLIDDATLTPGFQMPSTRNLASTIGVHRSTIYKAYQELWALGYLESSPGTYTTVRYRHPISQPDQTIKKSLIDWEKNSSNLKSSYIQDLIKNQTALFNRQQDETIIDMETFVLDEHLFPADDFRKCINYSIQRAGTALFQYGDPQGYLPLRKFIAKRLRLHGVLVTESEIFISNGTQNAINKIVQRLVRPGDNVIVESPGYPNIYPILQFNGANIISIPMTGQGMDLEKLEQCLRSNSASMIYTMPNFQNPTGITTSHKHREKLLSISEKYCVPIVEDAFEEEMKYFGCTPMPIKSMDTHQVVLYLGSFSKILFPGIRLGWIAAAPEFIEQLNLMKQFEEITSSVVLQAAMAEFGNRNLLDVHIKRLHSTYRKKMKLMLDTMRKKINLKSVIWQEPSGGYLIWLQLQDCPIDSQKLTSILVRHRVKAKIGSIYFLTPPKDQYLRLCISNLKNEQIKPAIERLNAALKEVYGKTNTTV